MRPLALATCWELLFATFGSSLCSSYAVRHEVASSTGTRPSTTPEVVDTSRFSFILDPSPPLLLVACLILGFSISSFAYRRQRDDRYQSLIFVLAITTTPIFGIALGINASLIMLGLVPWTLCLAMMFSVALHWAMRRCSRSSYIRIRCCETGEKEPIPLSEKQ
ncbi:uncharacterized protein RAG0_17239 [Rhynchosporium agropyri]|uniref:Uncharacterized protein n=1 Tax=Rhynchosporium agropyri TaxID=914238 RepID=A0A1E1LTB2_9HELO|nr:uncharacterized protein RAG0_17239 [Rhynchosporium agropyri]